MVLWADLGAMLEAARGFPLSLLAVAMALSLANYLVRFGRWERYRALLGVRIGRGQSLGVYLSGLAFTVTPGKMGEAYKSVLLRRLAGTPIHRSAPIVVAERFTDLAGVLVLVAVGGLASAPELAWVFWATLAGCALLFVLAGSRRFAHAATALVGRLPALHRLASRVEGAFESTRVLLRFRELPLAVGLATLGWSLECTAFWLVVDALAPGHLTFLYCTFTYAISAIAGAVLIIFPGGLGVTEASMGGLLSRRLEAAGVAKELAHAQAAAATILIRLCTLWLAVAVGLVANAVLARRVQDGSERQDASS
jgi:uncharacterized protein (TIRG00374 family)